MTQEFVTLPREVVERALEALDSAKVWKTLNLHKLKAPHVSDAAAAIRAALEQPQGEQKPRAWLHIDRLGGEQAFTNEPPPSLKAKCQPLYTHSQNLNCKSTQARLATLWGYVKVDQQPQGDPADDCKKLHEVPDGWKLVPVKPTHDMQEAGIHAHYEAEKKMQEPNAWEPGGFAKRKVRASHVYRAMISSAPEPQNIK